MFKHFLIATFFDFGDIETQRCAKILFSDFFTNTKCSLYTETLVFVVMEIKYKDNREIILIFI